MYHFIRCLRPRGIEVGSVPWKGWDGVRIASVAKGDEEFEVRWGSEEGLD